MITYIWRAAGTADMRWPGNITDTLAIVSRGMAICFNLGRSCRFPQRRAVLVEGPNGISQIPYLRLLWRRSAINSAYGGVNTQFGCAWLKGADRTSSVSSRIDNLSNCCELRFSFLPYDTRWSKWSLPSVASDISVTNTSAWENELSCDIEVAHVPPCPSPSFGRLFLQALWTNPDTGGNLDLCPDQNLTARSSCHAQRVAVKVFCPTLPSSLSSLSTMSDWSPFAHR